MTHFALKFKQFLQFAVISTFVSGCTPNFLIGDVASTIATDKTIGDHAVSIFSNKNCSSVRLERGETYCEEDDPNHLYRAPAQTHCYRELGKVTCYTQEDTYSVRRGIEDKQEPAHLKRP